jgi:hypothetical protein
MSAQKYSVNQHLIETLLTWVKTREIAIPEIQRPFVWNATKVRDLMDSLYQGYPVGYIIAWQNPNVRLKDGSVSVGKKVLIDGQQRITALRAAILGEPVIDKEYREVRIRISFNPLEERFEVQTPIFLRDKTWVADIADLFRPDVSSFGFITEYLQRNPEIDQARASKSLERLFGLLKNQVGLIELAADLEIETVTEIFIRINSQGVVLSQADFAMSKIASNEIYGGQELRKAIDYFCHLAVAPEFYPFIRNNDKAFAQTDYFRKMEWLRDETDDLYDPNYNDVLRVAFGLEFRRGRLSDLVSLLSGRNFETRSYEEAIAEDAFGRLRNGVMKFMNETDFKRFVMIVKSSGFISPDLIRSQNAVNFAYLLYLILRSQGENTVLIETYVRRWLVLCILTGRYSGSAESVIDGDLRRMEAMGIAQTLQNTEEAELSEAFWTAALIQGMNTSLANSPYFHVFLAAQIKFNDKGFLSKEITVRDMVTHRGDIHHLFPKNFLKKFGYGRSQYNQIANYVMMQQDINIKVGDKPPRQYFGDLMRQIESGQMLLSGINSTGELIENMRVNCIPESILNMDENHYQDFLEERRTLMAGKIRDFYYSL